MILTGPEMKALEERAISEGVTAGALMEEAGRKISEAVRQFCPHPATCAVFFGKGHNGGDALVAARHLHAAGWEIDLRDVFPREQWAELTARQHADFCALTATSTGSPEHFTEPVVILDGLLGIGAGGALREPIRSSAAEINRLRAAGAARVFAIDMPTGLDADTGAADADAVIADYTLTIGFPKQGLLADGATQYVGRLCVLPLEELSRRAASGRHDSVATPQLLRPSFPRRGFDMHKGQCGRVVIIAGSRGFAGAAVMAAEACAHAGAGLITLFVTEDIYPVVAAVVAPEIMVKPVGSYLEALDFKCDVIAIGPGIGKSRADEVRRLVAEVRQPMILDADALNIVSESIAVLDHCAGPRLLTPHPGEMARLVPASFGRERVATMQAFVARWPHVLLLKGARTLVGQQHRPLSYNSTGSPGMATGGMGDALTGVCAAIAGQGLDLYDAARLGAWVCGRAAEIAISDGAASEESLTPPLLIRHLGSAFADFRRGCW